MDIPEQLDRCDQTAQNQDRPKQRAEPYAQKTERQGHEKRRRGIAHDEGQAIKSRSMLQSENGLRRIGVRSMYQLLACGAVRQEVVRLISRAGKHNE